MAAKPGEPYHSHMEPEFAPIADLNEACDLVAQALAQASPWVRAAWEKILETLRNEF